MKPNRVAIIGADWPEYEKYCPNFVGMQMGLAEMGIEHKLFSCRPNFNPFDVVDWNPDLIIYGLIDLTRQTEWRKILRNSLPKTKIVMWYGDMRNEETGQIRADMSEIDAMFVSNAEQNQYYEDLWSVPKCHCLPLGSPVWHPQIKDKFDLDFIFVGATLNHKGFENRTETMIKLQNEGLRIIDAPANINPKRRAEILKQLPSLYRSAKISLDWSHFTCIKGYTSNRFWIITGAGGFALTKRFPGCEDFYPKGTRVYFDTYEEALELRDYYLEHIEEREVIRKAGHKHAKLHTYRYRFNKMFDIVYGKKS